MTHVWLETILVLLNRFNCPRIHRALNTLKDQLWHILCQFQIDQNQQVQYMMNYYYITAKLDHVMYSCGSCDVFPVGHVTCPSVVR